MGEGDTDITADLERWLSIATRESSEGEQAPGEGEEAPHEEPAAEAGEQAEEPRSEDEESVEEALETEGADVSEPQPFEPTADTDEQWPEAPTAPEEPVAEAPPAPEVPVDELPSAPEEPGEEAEDMYEREADYAPAAAAFKPEPLTASGASVLAQSLNRATALMEERERLDAMLRDEIRAGVRNLETDAELLEESLRGPLHGILDDELPLDILSKVTTALKKLSERF
jgi:hypothetical protein